jgi:hypothetical protein
MKGPLLSNQPRANIAAVASERARSPLPPQASVRGLVAQRPAVGDGAGFVGAHVSTLCLASTMRGDHGRGAGLITTMKN